MLKLATGPALGIAAVVPIDDTPNAARELLRGVAQAQEEAIQAGVPIKVLIADDGNDADKAAAIATALVKDPAIVGVIGHGTSATTLAAAPHLPAGPDPDDCPPPAPALNWRLYPREGSNFIFRVIPSDQFSGNFPGAGTCYLQARPGPSLFLQLRKLLQQIFAGSPLYNVEAWKGGRSPNWWICPRATHRLNWRRVEPMRLFCCRILPPLTRPLRWLRPTRNNSPSGRGTPSTALKLWKKGGASLTNTTVVVPWHPQKADPKFTQASCQPLGRRH